MHLPASRDRSASMGGLQLLAASCLGATPFGRQRGVASTSLDDIMGRDRNQQVAALPLLRRQGPSLGRDVHPDRPGASCHLPRVNTSAPIAGRTTLRDQSGQPVGRYMSGDGRPPGCPQSGGAGPPLLPFRRHEVRPPAATALIAGKRNLADHQETNHGVRRRHRHPRGPRVR